MNLLKQAACQSDDTRLIPLSRGLFATVDVSDYAWLSRWKWYASVSGPHNKTLYAARAIYTNRKKRQVFMHREILGLSFGERITADHIDGNGLNNRRSNLRKATNSQNHWNQGLTKANTSGFKGVCLVVKPKAGPWKAMIKASPKNIFLGYFASKQEAFKAYCDAATRLHGEFARFT